jgi:hypothetical protein
MPAPVLDRALPASRTGASALIELVLSGRLDADLDTLEGLAHPPAVREAIAERRRALEAPCR